MNDAFLQQVPHTICYVTTKETCPRTAVCLLPGPSPVCTACGPACAVYHGVGHTIDRPAAHFLQAGTFRRAAHPVPRRCARCVSRRQPALRHTHISSARPLPSSTAGPGPRPQLGGVASPSAGKCGRSGPTERTTGPSARPPPRFATRKTMTAF